jgi:hypothetical protein
MGEAVLSLRELNRATLARQGLIEPLGGPADAAVARLGSLQAQHPEWPPVALAGRAASPRSAQLAAALRRRAVVRSSLMRMTIHVVHADDFWPMFTVCQPLRRDSWRLLMGADPVDSPVARRLLATHRIAIAALDERPRSSLELDRLMIADLGEPLDASASRSVARAAWRHFAAFVPLVHVPHDGEGYGRSLYALAERWLGEPRPELELDACRTHLARRYLDAFGPASVDDLASYAGRGRGGTRPWRAALEALGDELLVARDESGRRLYDLHAAPRPPADTPAAPRLLARWDSVLLSHAAAHRTRVIADVHRPAVFTRNADVRPTFLIDGMVAGTWSLTRRGRHARIGLRPFEALPPGQLERLLEEAERVLRLLLPDDHERQVTVEH